MENKYRVALKALRNWALSRAYQKVIWNKERTGFLGIRHEDNSYLTLKDYCYLSRNRIVTYLVTE